MKRMFKIRHLVLALSLLLASSAVAQSPVTFQYFYDDARQLAKAVDSSGNVVEYVYDAAGNLVRINRSSVAAGAVAVFNFTTMSGAPGTLVTIQGQGFSTKKMGRKWGTKMGDSLNAAIFSDRSPRVAVS